MPSLTGLKQAGVVFLLISAAALGSHAQTYNVLVSFNGKDGAEPNSVVQGLDGSFYGTAYGGGWYCAVHSDNVGCGTIFNVKLDRRLRYVEFCNGGDCTGGSMPQLGLILAADGSFYGATLNGGGQGCPLGECGGTIFKVTSKGQLSSLYEFCNQPGCPDGSGISSLIQAADGNLYGTTWGWGAYSGGTVFKLTPSGALTTLYSFCGMSGCPDGEAPLGIIQASDGNFYGTAQYGGTGGACTWGCGTIFRITPQGNLTVLHNFSGADGAAPETNLIQSTDGSFVGTTYGGGANQCPPLTGCGTVFEFSSDGSFKSLYSFCSRDACADGGLPSGGVIEASDGNFYGTTVEFGNRRKHCSNGCGTLFRLTPQGALTVLHDFDREGSPGSVFQSTTGLLYGMAQHGRDWYCDNFSDSCGEIFNLDLNLPPFVAFVDDSGRVGQTGGILGQGFTGTTSVSLNGTPAEFTVVSDTFIKATVPPGATSGYVTVTTSSGTLTSNKPFRVIP